MEIVVWKGSILNLSEHENKILFYLINPDGCWHQWHTDWAEEPCKLCGERQEYPLPNFIEPKYRCELQDWFVNEAQFKFYKAFTKWQWSTYDFISGSKDILWLSSILLNLQNEILTFLHKDRTKQKFGWEDCPNCKDKPIRGYGVWFETGICPTCNGPGKVKKKWLIELENE